MSAAQSGLAAVERTGRAILFSRTQDGVFRSDGALDTDTAFRALYDAPGGPTFGWGIDPFVNSILWDLPKPERMALCAFQPVIWNGWHIVYIPGRSFSLKRKKKDRAAILYDLSSFWPGQTRHLSEIAATWGLDVPEIIARGDHERMWDFPTWDTDDLIAYATARAVVIGQLASALLDKLDAHGLKPRRLLGVGSIGSRVLREAGAKRWVAHYRPDRQPVLDDTPLLDIMLRAYYGGRVEAPVLGTIQASPIYRLDLRSAYLWALAHLGPLGFAWDHVDQFSPAQEDRMSLWRVRWDIPEPWIAPFPFREHETARLVYPPAGEGWYWWPEVRSALRVWGPEHIRIQEGYRSPRSNRRPFQAEAVRLYGLRSDLDKIHDPFSAIVKSAGNAAYGKLAQRLTFGGKVGYFYNPGLAGWICSAVRSRMLDLIGPQGTDNMSTLATMTDGLLTLTAPDPAILSDDLGGWRAERFERADLLEPGFYRLHHADGRVEMAQTGVGSMLEWESILDALTAQSHTSVTTRHFVPHILSDLFPRVFGRLRCRWHDAEVKIDPWDRVRRYRDNAGRVLGIDWRRDVAYTGAYRGLTTTALSASYPLPPAWSTVDYDPYRDAAFHAMTAS